MPRSRKFSAPLLEGLFASLLFPMMVAGAPEAQSGRTYLHRNWQIQSSCEAAATGEQISSAGFDAKTWHKADIPATVVGALVTDKTYPDPNYGTNLKSFPGMNYSDKNLFANQDMPEDSPFRCSWWYRTEFTLPSEGAKKTDWLNFLGINYRANIWINGHKVADANDMAGTYRSYEFDVTKFLQPAKTNAIAVEVLAPGIYDLGITWVDWNPTPPDKDMGIWKEVFLTSSGNVAVRNPFVASKLDAEYKTAELTISGEVRNVSNERVKGVLRAELDGRELKQPVELAGGESRIVKFTPRKFSKLKLSHPKLWWPYQMGTPHLYTAKLLFEIGKQVSDTASVTFGIREVTSELTEKGHRLFKVNGRKVLIRGAAWAPDLLFRWSSEKLDADLAYVRDMGMNTIRLEGRLDRDEFFEKTDHLGILVMPGWTCCDAWERWKNWNGDQNRVAAASLRDQITRLRNHPAVFVWLNGSDNPPPAEVESVYLSIEKELEWPNPIVSSASEQKAAVSGASGVKMTGPYEYVPPVYWLADTQAGGAYGYNTETSPGPAIPPRQSLEKFIPKDNLWPIDEVWNYHAGGERFTTVNVFTDGLNRRYGQASSLDDYERKAQAMTYDGPNPDVLTPTDFLKLELHDSAGKLISENFYWLSTKPDVLDWEKRADTVYTPQKEFADLTGLNDLPKARVAITKTEHMSGTNSTLTVVAENKGDSVAFMVHPRFIRGKGGDDVTPIFWSDNYFSLLPGEKKSVTAKFDSSLLQGASPELVVDGWNVEPTAP